MVVKTRYPQAISVNQFKGGFKFTSDYTDLEDTETNDSRNVLYDIDGDIKQRKGSQKLYNTRLTPVGFTARSPIKGHYYYEKLGGNSQTFNVVAIGDAWYNYTSSTASVIRSSLNSSSETFWNFIQIQDFRSASDDIMVGTNGVDPLQMWNGSASAILLSANTSATQVPIGKYILQHENRVYVANITDGNDADSPVKVMRTGFGSDGAPDPHRFLETFYVGGSDRNGEIQGQMILGEFIIYYTRNSIWRFAPGLGDVNDLEMVTDNIGLYAPYSLVNTGTYHIFLSERGVFAFDGQNVTHLSRKIDELLLRNSSPNNLKFAKAVFDHEFNSYRLYFAEQSWNRNTRNNMGLTFDLRHNPPIWQPPITGREVSYISTYQDSDSRFKVIYGDYEGYVYVDAQGDNDGINEGYNDNADAASTISNVVATSATFPTDNDGLGGLIIKIYSGTGEGQTRVIASNTSNTLSPVQSFTIAPDTTSKFTIGGIDSYWKSKEFDFGASELVKIFRQVVLQIEEQGDYNLEMYYIIDFKKLNRATLATLNMFLSGWVWGKSTWGTDRWGRTKAIKKKVQLRSTPSQSTSGTHLAVRLSNNRANETWSLSKLDFITNTRGRR